MTLLMRVNDVQGKQDICAIQTGEKLKLSIIYDLLKLFYAPK